MTATEAVEKAVSDARAILEAAGFVDGDATYDFRDEDPEARRYYETVLPAAKALPVERARGFAIWSIDGLEPSSWADDQPESRMGWIDIDLYSDRGTADALTIADIAAIEAEAVVRGWTMELTGRPDEVREDGLRHIGLTLEQRLRRK